MLQIVFPPEHRLDFPCHLQHIFGKSQVAGIEAETLQKGQGPRKPKDGWVLFNHNYIYVSTFECWKEKKKARQTKKTHTSLCFGG
jgi:hypothetical protein